MFGGGGVVFLICTYNFLLFFFTSTSIFFILPKHLGEVGLNIYISKKKLLPKKSWEPLILSGWFTKALAGFYNYFDKERILAVERCYGNLCNRSIVQVFGGFQIASSAAVSDKSHWKGSKSHYLRTVCEFVNVPLFCVSFILVKLSFVNAKKCIKNQSPRST